MTQKNGNESRDAGPERSEQTDPACDAGAEHFRTEHLLQDLGKRAISSGFVTAMAQGAKFVLNLTSAVVLARLLSPEEFGLVGMVLAVTAILGVFTEVGLSTATVQRETITQSQVSNLFWTNVALSGFVGLLSMVLATSVAWFYREPRLVGIMIAMSLIFLLTGSTVQHKALLIRQMRFKAIAAIEVASMVAGLLTGCSMALLGFTYWSLVGMHLCAAGTVLVMTWSVSGWRPGLPRRRSGVTPLVRFGVQLTASDLVARVAAGSDSILVGRFFGAESLGLYSRAGVLLARPLEQLLAPVSSVLIPVLSRLQSHPEKYRHTFLRAYDVLAMTTLPMMAMFLALSEPLVLLLLGPAWKGAVPLFGGFTLVAVTLPLSYAASWLFTSQGRGGDLFRTYVLLSFLTVAAYVAGLSWGPLGIVLSFAIYGLVIRLPILYHRAGRCGPVGTSDLWKGFLSYLPCWGAVYAATTLARSSVADAALVTQLVVGGALGLAAWAAVVFALQRPRESALYALRAARTLLVRKRRVASRDAGAGQA